MAFLAFLFAAFVGVITIAGWVLKLLFGLLWLLLTPLRWLVGGARQ